MDAESVSLTDIVNFNDLDVLHCAWVLVLDGDLDLEATIDSHILFTKEHKAWAVLCSSGLMYILEQPYSKKVSICVVDIPVVLV